jgi:hypothetical protein
MGKLTPVSATAPSLFHASFFQRIFYQQVVLVAKP